MKMKTKTSLNRPEPLRTIKKLKTALSFALLLIAVTIILPATTQALVIDRIVAVVNDRIITETELNAATAVAVGGLKAGEQREYHVKTKSLILDSLIESALIKQDAERIGIEVSELEIDESINSVMERNGLTENALIAALKENKLSYKEYRDQLRDEIIRVKFMGARFRSRIKIRDENVEEYFNSHIDEYYAEPSVRLAVLLLNDTDKKILQEKLKAIRQGLKDKEDFTELVKQFSDGSTAAQGGDIGYLHKSEISPLIESIADSLKEGEISKPVRAQKGIYIVKLIDRKGKEPRAIKEVEAQIRNIIYKKMLKQRYDYWLDDMKRTAFIDVRL